ncbi:MAG: DEAD/DEAH box helicase [Peptococcaceae bacterium]|nr:DEAD/DEAH box helicase [Peptococcaceae bacterium]
MKFTPHDYQRYCVKEIIAKPHIGLFLDMGLGKTVTTLTALDHLICADLAVERALVVAPKRVVTDTWARECEKWDHLSHLRVVAVAGTPEARRLALQREADIYLISRDNVKWLVETLGRRWPFDALVLDELSSFKNPQSQRFKALRRVSGKCERVIGLTGTPAPNGYVDLWSQIFLLDRGQRLGRTLSDFRRTYCEASVRPHFTIYSISPENQRRIDAKLRDLCISMRAADYLSLPPVTHITREITLDASARKAYEAMKEEAVLALGGEDIIGRTAAAIMNKLLQIASGAIYDEDGATREIHDAKLDALEDLIEEAQGQPLLVFYSYQFDAARIQKRFPQARMLDGDDDIAAWNSGRVPIMLAYPASCGHGLNLQEGGHIIVWFGLTWSLELYQQANARLDRQGQKQPVMIYHLIARDTIESQVLRAIAEKATTQAALIDCVKAEIGGAS